MQIYCKVEIHIPASQQIYSSLPLQRGPSIIAAFCFVLAAGTDLEIMSLGDAWFYCCLFVSLWYLDVSAAECWTSSRPREKVLCGFGNMSTLVLLMVKDKGHLKQRFYALDASTVVFVLAQSKACFQWNCRYLVLWDSEKGENRELGICKIHYFQQYILQICCLDSKQTGDP